MRGLSYVPVVLITMTVGLRIQICITGLAVANYDLIVPTHGSGNDNVFRCACTTAALHKPACRLEQAA